jgi:hypothetical protein|tara:strand:+ start:535 stop:756 length:222 start_codon:yes stop_codon:yes gene_type:complete
MKQWLKEWWKTLTTEEYELTVWFHDGELKHKKVFLLSAISKKSATHFVGKDEHGKAFEIKTVAPFDYHLRKIY